MALWYNDPQPQQRINRLPLSVFTTGDQPPRMAVAGAIVMACVLAAPLTGEPPLNQQNHHPRQVAPLTLTYGQQPPVQGPLTPAEVNLQVRTWDVSWGAQRQGPVAPFTLVYGDQPSIVGPASPTEFAILSRSWEPPRPEPPALVTIVPLTLFYGQQPPIVGGLSPAQQNVAIRSWDSTWNGQSESDNAAINIPLVVNGPPPLSGSGAVLTQRSWDVETRYPRAIVIAPLTLVYGQDPPRIGSLTANNVSITGSPAIWWLAQSENENAAWNFVPPVVSQPTPYVRFRIHMVAPAIYWDAQSESDNAPWNVALPVILLTRAIAQNDAADSLRSALGLTSAAYSATDATDAISASDSDTSSINSTTSGTSPIISSE